MRLFEIKGNSEEEVLSEIRHILFVLDAFSTINFPSADVISLKRNAIQRLNFDTQNLLIWVLKSNRVRQIHDAIQRLL